MQTAPRPPFVLVVDDHPLVADSLVACVGYCNATIEVETAESLGSALRILARRSAPLLIVTDLSLIDTKGTEAVTGLRTAAPKSPLLVFTALDNPQLRSETKALGAIDYLIKNASIQLLRETIKAAIGGRHFDSHTMPPRSDTPNQLLTPRQLAVLDELSMGRSNKQIAARMTLSEATVGSHMKEILSRLGVKNRTEAVVLYIEMLNHSDDRPRS